jgi:hypothetical protein
MFVITNSHVKVPLLYLQIVLRQVHQLINLMGWSIKWNLRLNCHHAKLSSVISLFIIVHHIHEKCMFDSCGSSRLTS